MLDAIANTPAPRAGNPAKAGQKTAEGPDEAKFQQVYGKGEKPQAKPQEQAAEDGAAAEAPAGKAPPDPTAMPLQPLSGEAPPLPDTPEPDTTAEAAPLPLAAGAIAPPPADTTAPPASTQTIDTAPEQGATEEAWQSRATQVEPPMSEAEVAPNRTLPTTAAIAAQEAAQTSTRVENLGDGRERDPRAGVAPLASTDEAARAATPRTEPTVSPSTRAAEVTPTRAAEVPVAATPAAEAAALHTTQTAQPAPTLPPLQSAAPAAPPPAAVIEQLVIAAKQTSDGRVDLTLSPAELGRVRMTLLAGETGITVAIHAERDDTLDLFRRNADSLAQEFRQMGYGSVGFEFRGGGTARQGRHAADDAAEIATPEPAAPLPVGILRLTGIGGLDIRL